MKYIVEVNAKYLVSVEANSLLQAEHKLLDYNHIWGALAFDQKMMKTDTFMGAVQGCEMISMNELVNMVTKCCDAKMEAVDAELKFDDAAKKVQELERALADAKTALRIAQQEVQVKSSIADKAEEILGKQRH